MTTILSGELSVSQDGTIHYDQPWEQKWLALQRSFARRDRQLDLMARVKSPAFMEIIRSREILVRQQEREMLFFRHFQDDSQVWTDEDDCKCSNESFSGSYEHESDAGSQGSQDDEIWFDAVGVPDFASLSTTRNCDLPSSLIGQFYEAAMFEWHTTLPCVLSLAVHCLAHASVYDIIEIGFEEMRKFVENNIPWINPDVLTTTCTLILGMALIRSSGYLYWWLNDTDFSCVKFDYHNRLRLKRWDARYLLWVKRRPVLQASMFVMGYHLCYHFVFIVYAKFFNSFSILRHYAEGETILPEDFVSSVGKAMQVFTELCRAELMQDEGCPTASYDFLRNYTWGSNEGADSIEESMALPLPLSLLATLFCTCVCLVSVSLLHSYGFAVFHKY